jgi:ribose transport system substrate-binding protein
MVSLSARPRSARRASRSTTYKGLVVIGYDAGKAQKDAVRKGLFLGSIAEDPCRIGLKAVELACKAFRGEPVPKVDTGAEFYDSTSMDQKDVARLLYD